MAEKTLKMFFLYCGPHLCQSKIKVVSIAIREIMIMIKCLMSIYNKNSDNNTIQKVKKKKKLVTEGKHAFVHKCINTKGAAE